MLLFEKYKPHVFIGIYSIGIIKRYILKLRVCPENKTGKCCITMILI